ncbi:MAG: hypothetical protein M1822_004809 [Bathelium mastoideum]|nr:MAG: hypothetical protein M1822_004809 [Bathelium mastoideum]
MPRFMAPRPSGEFTVRLTKPFTGTPTHVIEVTGEPNRPATVQRTQQAGGSSSTKKTGSISKDDVNELMTLVNQLRGFPSSSSGDVYGLDTKLELNTFEIQWASDDDETVVQTVEEEQKTTFKDVVDSIESLGRQFAKNDAPL